MQKTCFEKNLAESFANIDKFMGKVMMPLEVMDAFFPKKVAKPVEEPTFDEKRKNAIILVGPSCCGKTTYALKFVKEHPNFTLVSMDKCAAEEMKDFDEFEMFTMALGVGDRTTDDLGNRAFGEMLAAGHKNIIIDGNWMHVNSRGALLKTLDYYNYHTVIYLILPEGNDYTDRIESRVFEIIAAKELEVDLACILDGVDVVKKYADSIGLSVEKAKEKIRNSIDFPVSFAKECMMLNDEIAESNFASQMPTRIIFLGADELMKLEI